MTSTLFRMARPAGVLTAAALLLPTFAGLAFGQDPAAAAPPSPNKGDTTWMLVATVLVLLMTVPGLALFYGGMVRTKNMLSMLMQVFVCVAVISILWILYGYSVAFTGGSTPYFGGLSKAFLQGVTPESLAVTFSVATPIPEYVYIAFQMTFACITPALILGAFAERVKFSAVLAFIVLWFTFSYLPIAHMVWYFAGPDAIVDAAKALAAAADDAARTAAQTKLDAVLADSGYIWQIGAIDFAGGTVVHINAGIAGLVGALVVGKRVGYGRDPMPPHSLVMTMIGASLLWVGWFGFNAGSNLEANGYAALAFLNTFVATSGAAIGWLLIEWLAKGKPSLLGGVSGAVAGLVAITPAAGFAGPVGAIALGFVAGIVCFLFCTSIKHAFGYDDSLDVFGVHCIGGIIGAIGTGLVVNPAWGGTGVVDYSVLKDGVPQAVYAADQVVKQIKAVGITLVWSAVVALVSLLVVRMLFGLRVSEEREREGLDLVDHGERAYNY